MSTPPQWKRVLISGSNLEVNHLTSSTALDPYITPNAGRRLVFASSGSDGDGGHFQTTASIGSKHQGTVDPFLFLRSESLNVPNLPISSSTFANPIPVPSADPPLITFPVVFKNEPHGGFETTSSIAFDPVLKFEGFQSGSDEAISNNNYIRTGSTLEGAGGTLPLGSQFKSMPGQTVANVPFTFTGSAATGFYTSQSEVTYLDTSNGDFIEFNRAMPVGSGITASFEIPFFYAGAFQEQEIRATLRRWQPGGYATDGTAEYIDSDEFSVSINVFRDMNGWDDFTRLPASASFSGSFEVASNTNFPIEQGERFQLRIRAHENFGLGYSTPPTGSGFYGGGPLFKISGSTAVVGDELTGNFSGSFAGNVFGGMSSSLFGVTLNDSQNVRRGPGILMRKPDGDPNILWNGDHLTTMSIWLYPMNGSGNTGGDNINKSGLEVNDLTDTELFSGVVDTTAPTTLALATGLPQAGLEFDAGNKYTISVDLANNSGLTFASPSGDLKIADTFPGSGLSGSFGGVNGSASINLNPSQSGLQIVSSGPGTGKLALNSALAGDGLLFSGVNDQSDLFLDTNFAVTGSGSITLRALGGPYSLQVAKNLGQIFESEGNSQTISYNDNIPDANAALILRKTQPEVITFKDNLVVLGNLTILENSNVTSINVPTFKTTDPFITLNSGSNSTSPFNFDNGGFIVQTSSYAQGGSGQASGSAIFAEMGTDSFTINGESFSYSGWGVTKGKVPWDAHSVTPPFTVNPTPESILSASHTAYLSMVKLSGLGTEGDPGAGNASDTFYDPTSVDNLGSWYIDTGSTGTSLGGESNVYLYGIFD